MCFLSFNTSAKKVKWVKETVLVSGNCDMCKEKIGNESVRFNCRFDKEFKKWIPLNPA